MYKTLSKVRTKIFPKNVLCDGIDCISPELCPVLLTVKGMYLLLRNLGQSQRRWG